jgi:hypothetical protein
LSASKFSHVENSLAPDRYGSIIPVMHLHRWLSHRWYSFTRKHGLHVFLALVVVAVMGLVAFLMIILGGGNPDWRPHG